MMFLSNIHISNLVSARLSHFLSLLLFLQCNVVIDAKNHVKGQCPLRVPSDFSSTYPIHLGRNHNEKPKRAPLLAIGHRGSSYNVPEHTLEGYRLALELGADYLEMDLVPTKDEILVLMHDIDLNRTTDVSIKFPERHRNMTVDTHRDEGVINITGYFVQDFTLEEVKSLRVKQGFERTKARNRMFDGYFSIPTFTEVIDLLHDWNKNVLPLIDAKDPKVGGKAGLYVELKQPQYIMKDTGMIVTDILLNELKAHPHSREMFFGAKPHANNTNATHFGCEKFDEYQVPPLVLQCFESAVLESLYVAFLDDDGKNFNHAQPPLVYLVNDIICQSPEFWYDVTALNIDGIGINKKCLLAFDEPFSRQFMVSAREHNIVVHPYTERMDRNETESSLFDSAEDELRYMYCELGIDGIFAENVDMAVRVGLRGCDDFRKPIDLIEYVIKIEEEEGNKLGGKLCPQSEDDYSGYIGFACAVLGIFAGSLVSFWVTSNYYEKKGTKVRTIESSNDFV